MSDQPELRAALARVANFGCQRGLFLAEGDDNFDDGRVCDVAHPDSDEDWCAPCIAFRAHEGHPRSALD